MDNEEGVSPGPDETDDALAWETLNSTVAYSCPGFDVRSETVRLPAGIETDYDYVDEPPAVVVLPFTEEGDVVVIDEWRHAVGRASRGLPAGTVDGADADLAAAAKRELLEETGYETATLSHLLTVEPANGIANSVHHHFVARECRSTGSQRLDPDESIRVETVSWGAFKDAAAAGELRDGRALTAIAYLEAFGTVDLPRGS